MLQQLVGRLTRQMDAGRFRVVFPDGGEVMVGYGDPEAVLHFRSRSALLDVLRDPRMRFGEAYVEGAWNPANDDLMPALEVGMRNSGSLVSPTARGLRVLRSRLFELNTAISARRNISHHYDIDTLVYRYFLDEDMHYSCAYFETADTSLERAQRAKCDLIIKKLDLRPGARVLDIGCGWGSFALHLAKHSDATVVGITLSERQLEVARQRAREAGLAERVEFRLQDYRDTSERFDAIASIGMFEHVGRPQYAIYFQHVCERLAPDGVALIHFIGRSTPPDETSPWIRKYIFPGGYIPAASEVMTPIENSGLILTDLEILRLHYAKTLAQWHHRFQTHRRDIAEIMGERFCRMWRFYLQASEAAFLWGGLEVFHFQLVHDQARLPLTRNYLYGTGIQA